jgi:hypothetical protein
MKIRTSAMAIGLYLILFFTFSSNHAFANDISNSFIKNLGQFDDENVLYYTLTEKVNIFFQKDKISFVAKNLSPESFASEFELRQFRIDVIFEDVESSIQLTGQNPKNPRLNFYLPHIPSGIRDVQIYDELKYINVSNGIELLFYFDNDKLRFKYINTNQIGTYLNLKFVGINSLKSNENSLSELIVDTKAGIFTMSFDSKIETEYQVNNNEAKILVTPNPHIFTKDINRIQTKDNDSQQGGDLSWITYLGGSSFDHLYCIDADEDANLLLCGLTNSPDFPVTSGSFQPQKKGGEDAIILKLDKDSKIDWCTFIGGSAADRAINIFKRDSIIWVSGESLSHDFPITANAHQKYNAGGSADILMMRLDEKGYLIHATYHGGSGYDSSPDLAVDSKYNVWLIGRTFSNNFPVTSNAHYPYKGNFYDAFMISLDKEGDLRYCSFFPGDQDVFGEGIAIDSNDNVCITGYTLTENLPVTSSAYQQTKKAKYDAYLAKFTNLGKPIWITYFGGNGQDYGSNLTVDPYGNFFIFGFTNSTDLPTNSNVFQPNLNGSFDSYIAKFNNNGEFQWTTYFGGSGLEGVGEGIMYQIGGVKSDRYGNILVSGQTRSSDFPVTNDAFQSQLKGQTDAFIAKFDVNGKILYSTLLGGSSNDRGYDVVFDNEGYLVNVGWTESSDFPVTENAFQKTYNGSVDAYIFRLKECDEFFEYELIMSDDTSAVASKNIEIPFQLKINNGPPLIDKLVVKLRFVSKFFVNIKFSDGIILDEQILDKYTIYEIEFTDIQNVKELITLCTISFDSKLPSDFKTKIEIIDFEWSTDCSNTLMRESNLLAECEIPIQSRILIRDKTIKTSKISVIPLELEIDDLTNVFINYNNVITLRYLKSQAELIDITNGVILSKTNTGNYHECMIKLNNIAIYANNIVISNLTFEFFDKVEEFDIALSSIKWYEPCIESSLQGGTIIRECEEIEFKLSIEENKFLHNESINKIPIFLDRIIPSVEKRLINFTDFELVVSNNISVLSFDELSIINQTQDDFYQTFTLTRSSFEHEGNTVLIGYLNFEFTEQSYGSIEIKNSKLQTDDICNTMLLDNFEILFECDTVSLSIAMLDTLVSLGSTFSRAVYFKVNKKIPHVDTLKLEFKVKSLNNSLKINSIDNAEFVEHSFVDGSTVYHVTKNILYSHGIDSIEISFIALLDEAEFGSIIIFDIISNYECIDIDDSMIADILFEDICVDKLRNIRFFLRTFVEATPNPAGDSFKMTVKSIDDGLVKVQISNIYGEIVYANQWIKSEDITQLIETVEVKTDFFSSGTYIINLQTSKTNYSQKLIIHK